MYFAPEFSPSAAMKRSSPKTLPVVIFYEDIATADRALRSVRDSLRRQNDSRVLQPMLWNVQLFEQEHWLRLAAADVAAAELCLVSVGPSRGMSSSVAAWFRELTPRNSTQWITLAPFEVITEHHEIARRAG